MNEQELKNVMGWINHQVAKNFIPGLLTWRFLGVDRHPERGEVDIGISFGENDKFKFTIPIGRFEEVIRGESN